MLARTRHSLKKRCAKGADFNASVGGGAAAAVKLNQDRTERSSRGVQCSKLVENERKGSQRVLLGQHNNSAVQRVAKVGFNLTGGGRQLRHRTSMWGASEIRCCATAMA